MNYGDAQKQQVTEAVNEVVNKYKALALTVDQVPAAVRTQLTDKDALKDAKVLVAGGVSPDVLSKMSPEVIDSVQALVLLGEQILPCRIGCSSDTSDASQPSNNQPSQTPSPAVMTLPPVPVISTPVNPNAVEAFFEEVARLSQIVDPASLETAMLAAQAAMGPAKFLVNQAVQRIIAATTLGKQLEEKKRDAAIYMVSVLGPKNDVEVKKLDDEAREAYADGTAVGINKLLDGSPTVVGAKFLVDSIAQAALGIVGKAAGKTVSVGMSGDGLGRPGPKATGEVVSPAPAVTSGATRTGVVRTNAADWRALRNNWDDLGYDQILSTENRAAIAKGRTPKVDDAWIKIFPEDAGLKGEKIPMHHVQGSPLTVPLPDTRHLDAHMPGGFRYNPGGPGSALPAYPPKKGAE